MTYRLKTEFITKNSESRLYNLPVPVVGLTGGIASGKSTVAKFFQEKGIALISADQLVKNVYQTKEAHDFISEKFPNCISEDGSINFKALREEVFNHEPNKILIENFIYAKLPKAFLEAFQSFQNPELIIYDVPLLFEKGLDQKVDLSICVYTPEDVQLERLKTRDQITTELGKKILSKQLSIEDKKRKANFVIDNSRENNLESLKAHSYRLLDLILISSK